MPQSSTRWLSALSLRGTVPSTQSSGLTPCIRRGLLGGVLLIAAALRLWELGASSFWTDEVFSVQRATTSSLQALTQFVVRWDAHPPLYYALLWLWARLTGLASLTGLPAILPPAGLEFTYRLPTALLGVLNVYLIYRLTTRVAPTGAALVAALLAALSGVLVAQDVQVRMLTLMTTFALSSSLSLDSLLRRPSAGRAVQTGTLWVLMLFTQYLALIVLGAQLLWVIARAPEMRAVRWNWLWAALPLLLFTLWMPFMLEQLRAGAGHPEARVGAREALRAALNMVLGGTWPAPVPRLYWRYELRGALIPPWPLYLTALPALLGLLWGAWRSASSFTLALPLGFGLLWALECVTVVNTFDTWYLGPLMALLCVALGAGAAALWRRGRWGSVLAGGAVVVLAGLYAVQAVAVRSLPLGSWREVRAAMAPLLRPGDVFAFSNSGSEPTSEFYFGGLTNRREAASYPGIAGRVQNGQRVWLIYEYGMRVSAEPELSAAAVEWLDQHASVQEVLRRPEAKLAVFLFTPKSAASPP